jgi:CheY-like chemotaxis protein
VLAIDDEPFIARVIEQLLARDQMVVVAETAARAALARIVAGEMFDAIVCDLLMPEMDGIAFHAELTKVHPELVCRVIFLTGGPCTPAAQEFLSTVSNPLLEKPFRGSALKALIEKTADATAGPASGVLS